MVAMKFVLQKSLMIVWIVWVACAGSFARKRGSADLEGRDSIQMPSFQGGDINKFARWVASKLRYPKALLNSNISGRLVVQFVIERDGSMTYYKTVETKLEYGPSTPDMVLLKNWQDAQVPDSVFTEEIRRVVRLAPSWSPAKKNGKPVRVSIMIPVNFQLDSPRNMYRSTWHRNQGGE